MVSKMPKRKKAMPRRKKPLSQAARRSGEKPMTADELFALMRSSRRKSS